MKFRFRDHVHRHKGNLTIILFMCVGTFGIEAMKTGRDSSYCVQPSMQSKMDGIWHGDAVASVFAVSAVGAVWSLRRDSQFSIQTSDTESGNECERWNMVYPVILCETLGVVCSLCFSGYLGHICNYWADLHRFAMAAADAM